MHTEKEVHMMPSCSLKMFLPFEELRGFSSSSECHFSGSNRLESLTPGLRWCFKSVPANEYGATWDKSSQFHILPVLLCSPLDRFVICSCYPCFFSIVSEICGIKVLLSLPLCYRRHPFTWSPLKGLCHTAQQLKWATYEIMHVFAFLCLWQRYIGAV